MDLLSECRAAVPQWHWVESGNNRCEGRAGHWTVQVRKVGDAYTAHTDTGPLAFGGEGETASKAIGSMRRVGLDMYWPLIGGAP